MVIGGAVQTSDLPLSQSMASKYLQFINLQCMTSNYLQFINLICRYWKTQQQAEEGEIMVLVMPMMGPYKKRWEQRL